MLAIKIIFSGSITASIQTLAYRIARLGCLVGQQHVIETLRHDADLVG